MKAVVKVDIVDGKCVVIYSDGSEQELYEYPSDEGGGGSASLMDEKLISQNGVYSASNDGYDGYKKVNVNVIAPAPILKRITATENGQYDASDYNAYGFDRVTVNVPEGGGGISVSDLLKRVQPTGDIVFNGGTTLAPTLSYNTNITSFESTTINSFKSDYTFGDCTGLKKIKITSVINSNLNKKFAIGCSNLETVSLPKLAGQTTEYSFYRDTKLHTIDLGNTNLIQSAFGGCTILKKIIIRRPAVCTLQNISAFGSTPFESNGSGGTLYVPADLISAYQAASNWSTILGYTNNQIVALEGSEFENATADGTALT